MIQELCNIGNEHHIDTFYKIAIIEKSHLPNFSYLTPDATIESYITNLPDTAQVLITDLLPKNISVSNPTKISTSGKLYAPSISFLITPLDKNLQTLLETFNNKEVVVLISKHTTSHLYGTQAQPLLFSYAPSHSNDPSRIKGYKISCKGSCFGADKHFENIEFNIYTRGLAFQLAQEI